MKILIGTNNKNKFKNYADAFAAYSPNDGLVTPRDLGITNDVEEDGGTLKENAEKKAKFFAEKAGLITISDDTGLFVDALNGEPGLHTKRWHDGTDHDRCAKLLERLQGRDRTARYKWVVAAYNPQNKRFWSFDFELEGSMANEFKDAGGFGYDKMFIVPQLGKYYSELTSQELLQFGGRGRAVKGLLDSEFFKEI